jgi:hypothetical protein
MIDQQVLLARRLARYREAIGTSVASPGPSQATSRVAPSVDTGLAERLAAAVGGEVRTSTAGKVVWCDEPPRSIPVERTLLAGLPGQPAPGTPLICLDTETTGLATAAGTVAFLVGVGWWEGDAFRQVQLLVPDHSDEPAMLATLAELIPPDGWLVTYNGRSFDWPLLVARYRLHGSPPPVHAGHLDLLPVVRRLFRHRMADARLRTAEEDLLGIRRRGDVEGWEIPGRYLAFLRGGPAEPLAEVARHNDQDVRSLARLLGHLGTGLADRRTWSHSHPGDLAGLARAYARHGRLTDALECLDIAVDAPLPAPRRTAPGLLSAGPEATWWSPRTRPDFGTRLADLERAARPRPDGPWTTDRIVIERARLQRRAGDLEAAVGSWDSLLGRSDRTGIVAAIEAAKLQEHQFRDLALALRLVTAGLAQADRRRRIGYPEAALERDLRRRDDRLRRRLAARAGARRSAGHLGDPPSEAARFDQGASSVSG